MKEMIKRIREEKGGFTLAELLIVVAIVLVLVAIAVPVFTGAMDKANEAVRDANERSIKAQATSAYLLAEAETVGTGRDAAAGTYYVDKQGNVTKGNTQPPDCEGVYTVTVEDGTGTGIKEPTIKVTRANPV